MRTKGRRLADVLMKGLSVVVPTADHLLAGRAKQDCVLKLCRVAALSVTQGRIRIYDALVAKVLESHEVFRLTQAIEPAPAEGQSPKVLVDHAQQLLGTGKPGLRP